MLTMIVLQVVFLYLVFLSFEEYLVYIYGVLLFLLAVMVLYLLNCSGDPGSKITWLVITMIFPVVGVLLYWYTKSELGHIELAKRISNIIKKTKGVLPVNEASEKLKKRDEGAARLGDYLYRVGGFPVFENNGVTYFPLGENKMDALIRELEKAESFIFMEYFIIEEGVFWERVLDVLLRKAKGGVEVRLLCDGTNELTTLSNRYVKRLRAQGLKCKMFNRVAPFLSTYYNYRDHRKITVIDGHTAFNGGINLADEYINEIDRFGHWKDTAVMIKGEAVRSFTLMFLEMWNVDKRKCAIDTELEQFLGTDMPLPSESGGFVIPYGDRPLDGDKVGERVYMDILNRATRYVRIMTPYLILDSEMECALRFAAERGVEVTLMLPGIPDKKVPYALAKTHYKALLGSGVKIYEYSPGFVHAKVFVADDREAVVGSINLDYRSFYHHFESATYLYGVPCITDINADFTDTVEKCREVTLETVKKEKLRVKLLGALMKAVAPLL